MYTISFTAKIMAEEFLSDSPDSDFPHFPHFPLDSQPDREPVRIIVVGSRQGVLAIVHTLHVKTFASADEWSALQLEPMTGKLMSVVTQYVWVE